MIKAKLLEKELMYDGSQLSSLYAFKNFNIQGDSVIAFQGPCNVSLEKMVDLQDVINEESIFSNKMLHFIAEHFDMDLEKTVMRQRLLITILKEKIKDFADKDLIRKGDDLYHHDRKLSVSIATLSPVSTMIHVGLNIESEGTPIPTISLLELGVGNIEEFALNVIEGYKAELESIYLARCKVRGVL